MAPDPTLGITRCPCKPSFYCRFFHWPDLDTLAFSADCSVTWFWHTNFDCGFFRLLGAGYTELDTTWYGDQAHGGRNRSAEVAYSSLAPDSTFAFVGGPCCLTLDFVFALWFMITFYTLLTLLFCIVRGDWNRAPICWQLYSLVPLGPWLFYRFLRTGLGTSAGHSGDAFPWLKLDKNN
jgi:hypothetical protein